MICPYCQGPVKKTTGAFVYPGRLDLANKVIFICQPCDARVGTHPDGRPLGELANKKLRELRMKVHSLLDPMWRSGPATRREAYSGLAHALGIRDSDCHVGQFREDMCLKAIEILECFRRVL